MPVTVPTEPESGRPPVPVVVVPVPLPVVPLVDPVLVELVVVLPVVVPVVPLPPACPLLPTGSVTPEQPTVSTATKPRVRRYIGLLMILPRCWPRRPGNGEFCVGAPSSTDRSFSF